MLPDKAAGEGGLESKESVDPNPVKPNRAREPEERRQSSLRGYLRLKKHAAFVVERTTSLPSRIG